MSVTSNSKDQSRIFLLLLGLLIPAWVLVPNLSPFVTMCCISLSLFGLIKLHTLFEYSTQRTLPPTADILAWFFAWPGLNAPRFFTTTDCKAPAAREWLFAFTKTILGGCLFFFVAPAVLSTDELTAGWIALVGVVFMLHFGSFHLLALYWRIQGRDVRPIMNWPILATSVSDFWSKRWNLAFRDYAHPFLFKPLARKWSPIAAVLIGYLFSGIVHELAISVPAHGGYGLPTLYFTLQGLAILLERFFALKGGLRGWCWTLIVTTPSALIMFHPPFVRTIVVPLIQTLADL